MPSAFRGIRYATWRCGAREFRTLHGPGGALRHGRECGARPHLSYSRTPLPDSPEIWERRSFPADPTPDALATTFMPLARGLARRYANKLPETSQVDFDDIFSDALSGLEQASRGWRPGKAHAGYFETVIRNTILKGFRSRGALKRREEAPSRELSDSMVAQIGPERQVIARDQLLTLMSSLTPRQRQAVFLSRLCGFSQAEIAPRLGVSQMQVSRDLTAAQTHLKEQHEA